MYHKRKATFDTYRVGVEKVSGILLHVTTLGNLSEWTTS